MSELTIAELTPSQEQRVIDALDMGDVEGAIETVFELFPRATRDEAVDLVDAIEINRQFRARGGASQ